MADQQLGLTECVSIAMGGMIGGGIFAVLGVVAQIVHAATWFAFIVAGCVALCAGYAFNKLNAISDDAGGAVTFIQQFVGNSTLAGMAGWTLLFGYIGSMAMYAYAFGSFAVGLDVIPHTVGAIPLRPIVSVAAVAAFVGLNLLGAQSSGSAENVMVAIKIGILLVLGLGGLYYGLSRGQLETGLSQLASFDPVIAAAISFVAFQGWQLLFYDQERIDDAVSTIRKAVYIAIPAAMGIYVIVALTTVSLVPLEVIQEDPERALAVAADPVLPYGFIIISLAALFSTGSAINATLFSSGYFAKQMLADGLLPDRVGGAKAEGLPMRTLCVLGVITAALAAYGSLNAITSFASLTFILVFGVVDFLAFQQRDRAEVNALVPALGLVGSSGFFVLMSWHLFQAERGTFYVVLGLAVAIVAVELLYFERTMWKKAITPIEELADEAAETVRGAEGGG